MVKTVNVDTSINFSHHGGQNLKLCKNIISNSREKHKTKYEMISNKTTGPGKLKIDIMVPAKVYVSNEEEVPSLTLIGLDSITIDPKTSYR